jgi:gliding motility-associated-like protein
MKKNVLLFLALVTASAASFAQQFNIPVIQKGDSLDGFNMTECYRIAAMEHMRGPNLDAFVANQEKAFLNKKYHIKAAPTQGLRIPLVPTSACNNTDFETGTFAGWIGAVGYNANSAGPLTVLTNGISTLGIDALETTCSFHTLIDNLAGNDPYSGLPMLDPVGGSYAARLGGENVNINSQGPPRGLCTSGYQGPGRNGTGGEVLQQTFRVTYNNDLFTYKYSVIMNSAVHIAGDEPYFRVEVMDSVGNKIPCQQFYVEGDTAGNRPKGFLLSNKIDQNQDSVFYLPWTSNSINLSTLLGQQVTVRFTAAGCVNQIHFCYAYIDASCGPVTLTNITGSRAVCVGLNDTLTAPGTGGVGTYSWTNITVLPPTTAGIVGSTTNQSVIVTQPGKYEVLVSYPGGCNYKIDTVVVFHPNPVLNMTSTGSLCNGANNATATVAASGATSPYTYSWTPAPTGGQGTPTATGLTAPLTYTVKVTSYSGCSSTKTVSTTQPTTLTATNSVTNVSCHGGNNGTATAIPAGGTPGYNYSWKPSGGTSIKATGLIAGSYTCTVLDTNGCSVTTIATVTEPAVLSATNIKKNVKCYGDSTGRDTVLATGGTKPYSYSWTPYKGTASKDSMMIAGTYTCSIVDAQGCTTSNTITITQPPKLVLATSSVPTPCGGISGSATVNPTGGTGTYTYSWAAPAASATNTTTILTAGVYTVTVSDSNGCSKVALIPVSNTGGPRDSVLLDRKRMVTCNGGSDGAATVHGAGGTGTLTYSWTPPGTPLNAADTTITGLKMGIYYCTIKDTPGCQITVTDTITEPLLVTGTIASTNVACFGQSNGSATVTAAGGNPGAYTYSWNSTPPQTTPIASNLPAGTYTVSITDPKGCPGSATITITQPVALSASTTVNAVTCFGGNNGSTTVTASGGTTAYTYSWSAGSGGNAAKDSILIAGTYTVTVTDAHGCVTTATSVIKQPTQLTAPATSTNVLCNGGNTGSANVTAAGGVPAYTYSWSPTGGNGAYANGLTAGPYTCTVTDNHGCSVTTPVTITQPTVLTSTHTVVNITCFGLKNGSATAIPAGGTTPYSYNWVANPPSIPNGGTLATIVSLLPGTYTCNVNDANGCASQTIAVVTQPSQLSGVIAACNVSCFGGATGKDSITVSGGTPAYTYSWTPGNVTTHTITGLSAGTYTCNVTDANGCNMKQTLTVTQNAQIAGNPSTTQAICTTNNGTATMHPTGGTGTLHYSWSPRGGTGISASGLSMGGYACTITDSLGCSVVDSVHITKGFNTILPNSGSQAAICLSLNGKATVAPTGGSGSYHYTWSPGGSNASSVSGVGAGTYTCTITDSLGCTTTVPVVVPHGSNNIHSHFSGGPTGGMVPLVVNFHDSSSVGVTSWSWVFGDGGTATGQNVSNTFTTPDTYTVTETVVDANGCRDSSTLIIHTVPLASSIIIPNVFTPNNDGKNDVFLIQTVALLNYDVKIFDRWGVQMAHITDPTLSWDGKTSGGSAADAGTYYYVISATGEDTKSYTLTGFITLAR